MTPARGCRMPARRGELRAWVAAARACRVRAQHLAGHLFSPFMPVGRSLLRPQPSRQSRRTQQAASYNGIDPLPHLAARLGWHTELFLVHSLTQSSCSGRRATTRSVSCWTRSARCSAMATRRASSSSWAQPSGVKRRGHSDRAYDCRCPCARHHDFDSATAGSRPRCRASLAHPPVS